MPRSSSSRSEARRVSSSRVALACALAFSALASASAHTSRARRIACSSSSRSTRTFSSSCFVCSHRAQMHYWNQVRELEHTQRLICCKQV
eukprot:6187003-Pleurochrysis_carterae.AAC.7